MNGNKKLPGTLAYRASKSDTNVITADVRSTMMASIVMSGVRPELLSLFDNTITGTTDMALVTVGSVGAALDFELTFYFNGGKLGSPVAVTANAGTVDEASVVEISGVSDEQLTYMTEVRVSCVSASAPAGDWEIYFTKKAQLG